ncbi:GH3 auxin-responsive promoter family protein [Desulfoluna sp.]|uniref:GH3 auxin-responsive promoter family protein n=1 Tax=Desulfoluna sp. TaxID=2045199 RepID=UPI002620AB65|nr:GH3 auxin-responsive promoter family protein [Desulfoluna sp.]
MKENSCNSPTIPTRAMEKLTQKIIHLIFVVSLYLSGGVLYRRLKKKSKHPMVHQEKLLRQILRKNRNTQFGTDHNFRHIQSIQDFRQQVPVQTWDTLMPYVNHHTSGGSNALVPGKPIAYAATSGTTGSPKYIPITSEIMKKSHINTGRIFSYKTHKDYPEVKNGKILAVVSPAEEGFVEDGTPYGSTSGHLVKGLPPVVRHKYPVPYEIFAIKDYSSKYYAILRCSLDQDITMINSANASTLVLLAKKADEWKDRLIRDIRSGTLCETLTLDEKTRTLVEKRLTPRPDLAVRLERVIREEPGNRLLPKHYWPNLFLAGCWTGGNSSIYLQEMKAWYGDITIRDIGYLASEVRGSIPLWRDSNAGILTFDQNFFEFVPLTDDGSQPDVLTLDQLKQGEHYDILVTTLAGLYRYRINDIIEVTGFYEKVPTIRFVQKGSGVTSITGEKLYEQQLIDAVEKTKVSLEIKTTFYMGLAHVEESRYELYIEFSPSPPDNAKIKFMTLLDENLKEVNMEYRVKRDSMRLHPVELRELASGAYEKMRLKRISQGCREAQFKPTLLTQDTTVIDGFEVIQVIQPDYQKAS